MRLLLYLTHTRPGTFVIANSKIYCFWCSLFPRSDVFIANEAHDRHKFSDVRRGRKEVVPTYPRNTLKPIQVRHISALWDDLSLVTIHWSAEPCYSCSSLLFLWSLLLIVNLMSLDVLPALRQGIARGTPRWAQDVMSPQNDRLAKDLLH